MVFSDQYDLVIGLYFNKSPLLFLFFKIQLSVSLINTYSFNDYLAPVFHLFKKLVMSLLCVR